ncbi:MAG: hypothetical protein J6A52_06125 [Bacilli bacterium]|nr:hypothetical protein [Bacilli bacterium]
MYFKVDYDKVSEVGNSLVLETEKLNSLYMDIVEICQSINENWHSEDSSIYIYRLIDFLNRKVNENENLNVAGRVLKDISFMYSEQDNRWLKELVQNLDVKGKVE